MGGRFAEMVTSLTEPILSPVRKLLYKIGLSSMLAPIDFSFIITYLILIVIQSILSSCI